MRYRTTDPRTAGFAAQVGEVVSYVSGGTTTVLVKVGTGDTAWAAVSVTSLATPAETLKIPAVTTNPTTGRAAQVGELVLFHASGLGTYFVKYGTGDTDWVALPRGVSTTSTTAGTVNTVAKFTGPNNIGDSSITDTGSLVTVANPLSVTGNATIGDAAGDAHVINGTADFNQAVNIDGTLTLSTMTSGSVLFAGAGGLVSQDNAGLFWNDANNVLVVTTATTSAAVQAVNSDASNGCMSIRNTNASGPVDFFALDSAGTARVSWGYGNASYSDGARAGKGYVWRNGVGFAITRTGIVDLEVSSLGALTVNGATTINNTLDVTGNCTLGDASGDAHTINGTATVYGGASGAAAAISNTKLTVENNAAVYLALRGTSTADKGILFGNPSSGADGAIVYDNPVAGARTMDFRTGGNVSRMVIDASGNITAKFDFAVNGNATIGNATTDSHTIKGFTVLTDTIGTTPAAARTAGLIVEDDTALAADVGGSISFRGVYTGSSTTEGGCVKLAKSNATDGNYGFDLVFACRPNLADVTESIRLKSTDELWLVRGQIMGAGVAYGLTGAAESGSIRLYDSADGKMKIEAAPSFGLHINSGSGAATTIYGALAVNGNTTIGNAAGDAHVVNGTLDCNQAVNIDGAVTMTSTLAVTGAITENGVAVLAGTIAANTIPKGSSGNLADSTITDDGSTVTTASLLSVTGGVMRVRTGDGGSNYWQLGRDNNVTGDFQLGTSAGVKVQISSAAANSVLAIDSASLVTITGGLSVTGNVTSGDTSTDTHTLNGNLTLQNAPTAGSLKVGSVNARVFLARQVLTAASGTYTPTTGTKAVLIRLVGGGGGGGGALGAAGVSDGWAGGGASGAYIEKWIDPAATVTGGAYANGAAGAAGASTPGNGGTGGDTTIVVQAVTYTAKGGTGGTLMNAAVAATAVAGGTIQAGSSASDVSYAGAPGLPGLALSITAGAAGNGGSSPLGAGGPGSVTDAAGTAGAGNGSGGGGAGATTITGRAGGAGTIGLIIVDEYA